MINQPLPMPQPSIPDPFGKPPHKLYGVAALDIATFAGSVFAGFLLIAQNWRVSGDVDRARNAAVAGCFLTLGLLATLVLLPGIDRVPDLVVRGLQVWGVHLYSNRAQRHMRESHKASGGQFHTKWRAFAIVAVIGLGVLAAVLGLLLLLPESWLPPG